MKRLIRSSQKIRKKTIKASSTNGYTDYHTYNRGGTKFSIHSKQLDDPYKFECAIEEIHPYDDADYYWVKKGSSLKADLIKNGRKVGDIFLDPYDDELYETPEEYVDDMIDYMCVELKNLNKEIKPRMMYD